MKSKTATVHFNAAGTPVANDYDDVYFSNDSGIDETRHVFIAGNDLPARWQACEQRSFVIAETGFGTGLNFLVAMQAFQTFRHANPDHPLQHLYFISLEKFPLCRDDMSRALSAFPALQEQARTLDAQYPVAMHGCHRLEFADASVTLDLWMGDAHELLPSWACPSAGLIDAWFLDGFAPSKNPDMWTDALFDQMARLTKVGGSFATFTAAGVVKRGLAASGFTITKRKGFGRKRDMLTGQFTPETEPVREPQPPYSPYTLPTLDTGDHVVIVGAGLAGACCAQMLCEKGIKVTLLEQGQAPAGGASGNPQGGFYPQLHGEASHASQLQAHSFLYARRHYDTLTDAYPVAHDFCGVLQLGFNAASQNRHEKLIAAQLWPETLVTLTDAESTSALAGVPLPFPALSIALGGWLSPPDLIAAMLQSANKTGLLTCLYDTQVREVTETQHNVELVCTNGRHFRGDHLILAPGHQAISLPAFAPVPLRPVRGQVEAVPTTPVLGKLKQVLCHKGYLTPALNGRHALGSTYVKQDTDTSPRQQESAANLTTHQQALSGCDWITSLQHDGQARAAVRLGVPDHQPLCGALGEIDKQRRLYSELQKGKPLSMMPLPTATRISTLTALGSRGLTTAPLMAQTLTSALLGAPLPLPAHLLHAINPNRFIIRDCIRGRQDTR
ncbi:tRNA 5-methylaminomethyl-2-thiouridine biosynthesis bifunctional protein MnmC [Alteromonas halophila]|uniref:tRNA 5-methylaminomethyl-2-thiouridine biosynthesis bifunctional protein MnmC n=1 Tax=Alteromonas halophila TaxID=516698 RepID=A0A918JR62_9ALTE|nr:tRNA 5-methylaminomethyl-2-thiouridine biosynthesis bifunctional protein MnmC [Alteromonas halophila]